MGVYIWGTGCSCGEFIQQGIRLEQITAFIDNHPTGEQFLGKPVIKPEQLSVQDVTLVIITSRHAELIRKQCLSLGLRQESLFFLKNNYVLHDLNESCHIAEKLLKPEFLSAWKHRCHIVREPLACPDRLPASEESEFDYVRVKTAELLALSAAHIPGEIGELGVYQGSFSRVLNRLFPERKLYLFDTFEGFDPEEAKKELLSDTCTSSFIEAHKNTTISRVIDSMPYPEQIRVYQGHFPESAVHLEETFAFVSLDVDFEDTTFAGLSYFWPRLSSGGYMMIHDYNSQKLTGVRHAVARYENFHNIHLPGVPLCDINGTLVLCKP